MATVRAFVLLACMAVSALAIRVIKRRTDAVDDGSAEHVPQNSTDSFLQVTGTRRRCCGHRRRRYGQCTHDLKANHRRRRQCDCGAFDFGESGSNLIVEEKELYDFKVGETIFNQEYVRGEQEDRSISQSVYGHAQASASAGGVGWKASVKAQTGFEVNTSLSWSWYSSTKDTITNTVTNEPVCYWQEHFYAYDRCGTLKGDWAGALENANQCPPYFHVLYRRNF